MPSRITRNGWEQPCLEDSSMACPEGCLLHSMVPRRTLVEALKKQMPDEVSPNTPEYWEALGELARQQDTCQYSEEGTS